VITQLEDLGPLPDTGSVRRDLLLFFAGRVRVAHTRQWEHCMPALVEAAAFDPDSPGSSQRSLPVPRPD